MIHGVSHQGKEFNNSWRKRSGSGISERRPRRQSNDIRTWTERAPVAARLRWQEVCILTYDVENLRQGLSRHEFILEGPENALGGLVDWHVVVTDIFCQ